MKTKMKKIVLVALMFGTLIGYATEGKNTIDLKAKKTVKVEFNNVKKGQTLTIKDNQGVIVYNNEIKNTGNYSRTFDFSALEEGVYSAELNKDFEIIIKQFYVKNGLVTLLNNNSEKIFKPIIRTEGNLVYLSKMDFNEAPLKVVIYYNNEVLLDETTEGKKLLNRIYKLSEKEIGDYKVVISSNDRTYVKNFTL
jgi:hypothetical protein